MTHNSSRMFIVLWARALCFLASRLTTVSLDLLDESFLFCNSGAEEVNNYKQGSKSLGTGGLGCCTSPTQLVSAERKIYKLRGKGLYLV